jgi:hypothetical protein
LRVTCEVRCDEVTHGLETFFRFSVGRGGFRSILNEIQFSTKSDDDEDAPGLAMRQSDRQKVAGHSEEGQFYTILVTPAGQGGAAVV